MEEADYSEWEGYFTLRDKTMENSLTNKTTLMPLLTHLNYLLLDPSKEIETFSSNYLFILISTMNVQCQAMISWGEI